MYTRVVDGQKDVMLGKSRGTERGRPLSLSVWISWGAPWVGRRWWR